MGVRGGSASPVGAERLSSQEKRTDEAPSGNPTAKDAAGAIGERAALSAGNGQDSCNPEIASDSAR